MQIYITWANEETSVAYRVILFSTHSPINTSVLLIRLQTQLPYSATKQDPLRCDAADLRTTDAILPGMGFRTPQTAGMQ